MGLLGIPQKIPRVVIDFPNALEKPTNERAVFAFRSSL